MVVVERQRHGYRVIDREKDMVQLGRGSLEGRPLTEEAIERGVAAMQRMAGIAERWQTGRTIAVATSAIREAPNGRRFITAARRAAGIDVRVISGEEEADYIWRAVRSAIDFHGGTALAIDIGGGSVEFIAGTTDDVFLVRSEPLGALRIAQAFGLDRAVTATDVKECRAHVRGSLKKTLAAVSRLGFDFAAGTSGTIVTLASLAANGSAVSSGLRWLPRRRVRELIGAFAPLNAGERARRFDLDVRRAETILGGAIVLDEIMRKLDVERLLACDAALREGIVEYVLDEMRSPRKKADSVRRSAVLSLIERSDVELSHAAHVARLALRIFDQLGELHRCNSGERELLEYAALLHEVGTHVSYRDHQKHSYYLISHAGLRGFTTDQVAIVANVARYYRKPAPSVKHENFAQLSSAQQEIVRRLAAILRIADALDRGRRRAVRDVGVETQKGRVRFEPRLRGDAEVELASAAKRAKYFEKVFDTDVTIVRRKSPSPALPRSSTRPA